MRIAVAILPLFFAASVHADAVTEWNTIMRRTVAVQEPLLQDRTAAIMHVAMFEAVNAIAGGYEPYARTLPAKPGASPAAAAIAAAHGALVALVPQARPVLDAERARTLAAIPDGAAKDDGLAVGVAAAAALLAMRAHDGAEEVVAWEPRVEAGRWRPTPPANAAAVRPGWGTVKPFALDAAARVRLPPPPAIDSPAFAAARDEIRRLGGAESTARPADRTRVAKFYAVVLSINVYGPAARQVAEAQHHTLAQNARTFALLQMATFDALVECFASKYHYGLWRPVTAIRAGGGADASWLPLINTPPHPSYPSAHAAAGGAAAEVLESAYGADGVAVKLDSPLAPGVTLEYGSWRQILDDIDDARIYGGVHYRFDQQAGTQLGRRVGAWIVRHALRPRR